MVDKEGFESCSVDLSRKNKGPLFKCDDPVNLKYKVVTFKAISPIKGEPEFEAGKEYYFIGKFVFSSSLVSTSVRSHNEPMW